MIRALLLLGSNEGDRETLLNNARLKIQLLVGKLVSSSSIFETAAWGNSHQPQFLNQAIAIDTLLKPNPLLSTLLAIEVALGRKRTDKWAARTMDIDIMFYGDQIINEPHLIIPHPELASRRFALTPLNELVPNLIHPVLHKGVSDLLATCTDMLEVRKYEVRLDQ